MVEPQSSKLATRVRFPSPAPPLDQGLCKPLDRSAASHATGCAAKAGILLVIAGRPGTGKARAKGTIGTLRSGSLRVRAYAGVDPVTRKRHDLVELVPPGPNARRQAEAILARFLREIEEKRNPRTTATS